MQSFACKTCGAGLPPPDAHGVSRCVYCGSAHSSPAAADLVASVLADALADRMAEDAARIPMTDEAVLALLRQHFTGAESMFLCPHVPPKKEHGARRAHAAHLPTSEWVLGLFDDTVFGSGEEGFVITSRRLCWKNVAERPHVLEWRHLDPDRLYPHGRRLVLGAGAIEISGDEAILEACTDAFHVLALSARAEARAAAPHAASPSGVRPCAPTLVSPSAPPQDRSIATTRPPPHRVTYHAYAVHSAMQPPPAFACWHCQTPLYWNTPQCARCGAWPTPQGWLRTA